MYKLKTEFKSTKSNPDEDHLSHRFDGRKEKIMSRKLFGTKSLAAISVVMLFTLLVSTSQSQDDVKRDCCDKDKLIVKLQERVARDLDVLASQLSVMLAQDATRNFFAEEITKAKKRTVGLGQALAEIGRRGFGQQV